MPVSHEVPIRLDSIAASSAASQATPESQVDLDRPSRVPVTLYRVQLHRGFTFADARALIPYLTAGFPTYATSLEALRRASAAGADFVEVGVPFSDPLADGPTIQRTTQIALEQGMTLARVLDLIRDAALAVPVTR